MISVNLTLPGIGPFLEKFARAAYYVPAYFELVDTSLDEPEAMGPFTIYLCSCCAGGCSRCNVSGAFLHPNFPSNSLSYVHSWYLGKTPNDKYVQQMADYFTKYTFADSWRDHKAHGLYADGSTSNGTNYGAWLVMNTRDTYFGGPLHSDLTVDGITYNYVSISPPCASRELS